MAKCHTLPTHVCSWKESLRKLSGAKKIQDMLYFNIIESRTYIRKVIPGLISLILICAFLMEMLKGKCTPNKRNGGHFLPLLCNKSPEIRLLPPVNFNAEINI